MKSVLDWAYAFGKEGCGVRDRNVTLIPYRYYHYFTVGVDTVIVLFSTTLFRHLGLQRRWS